MGKQEVAKNTTESGEKAVIELSESRGGKKCISMKIDSHNWILVGAFSKLDAFLQEVYFTQIGIESKKDLAFDWRLSTAQNELIPIPSTPDGETFVGVYIPEDKFDSIVDSLMAVK